MLVNHHHHHSQSIAAHLDKEEVIFNEIIIRHPHQEIWGVYLRNPKRHVPTQIILRKILNHNGGDLLQARNHLKRILDWREHWHPQESLLFVDRYDGLGTLMLNPQNANKSKSKNKNKENCTKIMMRQNCRLSSAVASVDRKIYLWRRIAELELAMSALLFYASRPIDGGIRSDNYKMTVLDNLGGRPIGDGMLLPLRRQYSWMGFQRIYDSFRITVNKYYPQVFDQHFQYNLPPCTRAVRRSTAIVLGRDFVENNPWWKTRLPYSHDMARVLNI
jgi:hypothetical protein